MSSTAITLIARIILRSPNNWIPWLEIVKSTAIISQIWEYINLSKTTDQLPELHEP
jgi:hypothetical protein